MTPYRIAMWIALPVLLAVTLYQRLRGRLPREALCERCGHARRLAPKEAPLLWLHGASNGELASARWLVADLLAACPELHVRVTCNTASARAMVQDWGLARLSAALSPFDTPQITSRFLRRQRPVALIVVENELWPARLITTAKAGLPILMIGARMSARSARGWARVAPRLLSRMLATLGWVSAQDQASADRLLTLGLDPARLGPVCVLKSHAAPAAAVALPFPPPAPRSRTLLAASTHEGEDAAILDGFALARAAGTFDHLILAPRHPRRSPAIAALIAARGLAFAIRSAGQNPGQDTAVHLADTLGEMPLWYAMAGATFIGGTLVPKGGHTPYEPLAAGSALLHGPSTSNFADAFARLDAAHGAIAIANGAALSTALIACDAKRQAQLCAAARTALPPETDSKEAQAFTRTVLHQAGLTPR